jgi:hypothetical protein
MSISRALFNTFAIGVTSQDPTPTTGVPTGQPMVLASTGLDITVPVVIGLAVLVLGTVMVGWAFLATGRRGQHH